MRRKRSYKGVAIDYGAAHREVIYRCCRRHGDLRPREMEILLLCHQFQRYGGCFTKPQIKRSGVLAWEPALFTKSITCLQTSGYVIIDPDYRKRAYRANVYNLTTKGDLILSYYNRQVTKVFDSIRQIASIRRADVVTDPSKPWPKKKPVNP